MFRGREITHPEVGMAVLKLVAEDLENDALMEKAPSFEGRFLTMVLSPGSNANKRVQKQEAKVSAKA
jgi:translation initiation factor IF-3